MKIYETVWFKEFECLCASCPSTCCRGWVVPLSGTDIERLRREKGRLSVSLFFATEGWSVPKFNSRSKTCHFLGRDGLCTLQKKKGHDFIPWTCQSYPRFYRNYGEFEECCLDLSCPGAARLFMKHEGSTELLCREGDPHTRACTTNDDRDFLSFLLRIRDQMMEECRKEGCGSVCDPLFLFSAGLQDDLVKGGGDLSASFTGFYEKYHAAYPRDPVTFPLPLSVIRGFLSSSLYHVRLKRTSPAIHALFGKAQKFLKGFGADDAAFKKHFSDILTASPLLGQTAGRYLAYYLFQYFMRAYETYSFRRQAGLGICHLNMVLVLLLAVAADCGRAEEMTAEMIADTMALYNRRAYFNDDIQDQMYRIFEDGVKVFASRDDCL